MDVYLSIFKAHLTQAASLCNIIGKLEKICQNIRQKIVDLSKSGLSLGAIFKFSSNYTQVFTPVFELIKDEFYAQMMSMRCSKMWISIQEQKHDLTQTLGDRRVLLQLVHLLHGLKGY